MPSFQQRSTKKELLDGDAIAFAAIQQNMQELNTINHLLGGHAITLQGIEALVNKEAGTPWHIVEIGCGGGDNLQVIKQWAAKKNIALMLTGIDINKECIAFANQQVSNNGIQFIHSDYRLVHFDIEPAVIFSSLFCHHFSNEALVAQLQWMHKNSSVGFFINDLHRHPLAYYSIRLLTSLFSKSYLVKNDAPLSVLRGFKKEEWESIFQQAHLPLLQCHWRWAFRWLIICRK